MVVMKEKSVRLRSGGKGIIAPGHPWIFRGQLLKTDPAIKPGDIISVTNEKGEFVLNTVHSATIRGLLELITAWKNCGYKVKVDGKVQ